MGTKNAKRKAIVPVRPLLPAKALRPKTATVPSFTGLCAQIREQLDELDVGVFRGMLAVADRFAEAKRLYEAETGTGHGKRNPEGIPSFTEATAAEIGRSTSFVERYVRISQLDSNTRRLIDERPEVARSFTALFNLVREPDIQRRVSALEAHDEGGTKAMNAVLKESSVAEAVRKDPALSGILKDVADPTTFLGGMAPTSPVPAELLAKHEFLKSFESVGDVRQVVQEHSARKKRPREEGSFRDEHGLGVQALNVGVLIGGGPERVRLECGAGHEIEVLEVQVPWQVIEALVEERARNAREVANPDFVDVLGHIDEPGIVSIKDGTVSLRVSDRGRKVRGPKR